MPLYKIAKLRPILAPVQLTFACGVITKCVEGGGTGVALDVLHMMSVNPILLYFCI